ncbi:MAG: Nif3-like dinuclear metal center hexameric protein [Lentisphaeria bacterium]|nr:Nif3-like dinuclear metal center hexameric protein [Lentisphaeria bacterium]
MKTVSRNNLVRFLDQILELDQWPDDPSNNGLQFEGDAEIAKAVFAVDASAELFCKAADLDAEFVFVHHGISWGSGIRRIDGILADRVKLLAANGTSLYAAHLPLDANPRFGHNARLSDMIGLAERRTFGTYHGRAIGFRGILPETKTVSELAQILDRALPSSGDFGIVGDPAQEVKSVGIISGGGAWPGLFDETAPDPVDCLITGEATHEVFHPAKEYGTAILTLGHYRSETPGVFAAMDLVKSKFGIETAFVDIPTNM